MNGNDKAELFRTHPDYVIYVPDGRGTGGLPDVANEHFLVFRRGDGTLAIEVKYPDGKDCEGLINQLLRDFSLD